MKGKTLYQAAAFVLFFVLSNGCAVNEQFKRNYQEATESYYVPENLNGDPKNTGILLVDAITKEPLNTMYLSGVAIVNIMEPDKKIVFGSFRTGNFLSQISGVVVIPNLQPGTYRVLKTRSWNINGWETLYMPTTKDFEIEIKAGEPIYFGQIKVQHKFASAESEINIKYSQEQEVESWKKVLDKYNESPWKEIIQKHIKTL